MGNYLGGNNQTMLEIRERVHRVLSPLTPVEMGHMWQCRCGSTKWVKYRAHFYCHRCGARQTFPDMKLFYAPATFREIYQSKLAKR